MHLPHASTANAQITSIYHSFDADKKCVEIDFEVCYGLRVEAFWPGFDDSGC